MRTRIIAGCLAAALVAQPAAAQGFLERIDNEDIGRAVGAIGGALIGAQIGSGSGKLIAVAVGTLGGLFLGGEIAKRLAPSDQQGIANTSQQALETGQPVAWTNPDTGVTTRAEVVETVYRPAPTAAGAGGDLIWRVPPMQLIGDDYLATAVSNVRGGPGTEFAVMRQLRHGERVHVAGKVVGSDWYMIADDGIGNGFVHADLLRPAPDGGTVVHRPASTELDRTGNRQCSLLQQEVVLPDGTADKRQAQACRSADGTWELV